LGTLNIKRVRIVLGVAVAVTLWVGNLFMADAQTHDVHPHMDELKNDDGSWKFTNRLVGETSPYLLQHAHNPVDWYPWGDEAFAAAREQGKPIFLSVGYSTCYWCHVMERQVFENPALAALMNEHFICIKVDREERPDVDDIYMAAVQLMTQRGGWPMSVFLTPPSAAGADDPGLKPFWAGTYIPPEPRMGQPGITQVIEGIVEAWTNDRPRVLEVADRASDAVRQQLSRRDTDGPISAEMVTNTVNQLLRGYDQIHGGFGDAPKFPSPTNLLLLESVYQNNQNAELWNAVAHTLDRMARGGMYDQVGGGFHRYATDEKWLVPHFEKMLYDNALLVEAYLIAQSIKPHEGDPSLYMRIAQQTCDYVLREMVSDVGTFYSAQDAEVDAREGGNYLWQPRQVSEAIHDRKLSQAAMRIYGLGGRPNFRDPHDPAAEPAYVLSVVEPYPKLADDLGVSLMELISAKEEIDRRLLKVRDQRKQPGTDDKTLASWNGLMIAAMARAGGDLGMARYTQAAQRAADYILEQMRTADGGLYRTMRGGEVKIAGFLEDYAYFIHGLIELHRADDDVRWLDAAKQLADVVERDFAAETGGYYDTLADQADLFVRTRTTFDGATPSGNSQMAHDLLDLYELTRDERYLDRALSLMGGFSGAMRQAGAGMAHMHHALLRALTIASQRVAQVGRADQADPVGVPARPLISEVDPPRIDLATGHAQLRVTLTIGSGYHINANQPGVRSVVPTTLSLADAPGMTIQVSYPPGNRKQYAFADQPIRVYEGQVTLVVAINRNPTIDSDKTPRLVLRYQVCTDNSCLRPTTVNLPVEFVQASENPPTPDP
jgi:uncharacterized protein YyaL (SSP411 family)